METLFETFTNNSTSKAEIPIVLIDKSGSTSSRLYSGKSIYNTFIDIIIKHIFTDYRAIFWCTKYKLVQETIRVNNTQKIFENMENECGGSTDVSVAFNVLPVEWIQECENIYILTDGDINRDKYDFANQIKQLINKYNNINIHIISLENNKKEYSNEKYDAGNKIYQMIRNNKLTWCVRRFISYNNFYKVEQGNYYTNLDNPIAIEGYVPYDGKYFLVNRLSEFLVYINKILTKDTVNKIIYNLSFTIHHLVKSKPSKLMNNIVDMFCELIVVNQHLEYNTVREILVSQIESHQKGMTGTFQDYIENRTKLFEKANKYIMNDCMKSISPCNQVSYVSIPYMTLDNHWHIFESNKCTGSVKIRDNEYINAGLKNAGYCLPMFPKNIVQTLMTNQCMRQWIRTVFSHIFSKTVNSDIILYKFLTVVLHIHLSELDESIKLMYRNLALIMLDRKRFSTKKKEMEHLLDGNPPMPVLDNFEKMNEILTECSIMFGVKPFTFWYAVCKILNHDKLCVTQKIFCKEDMDQDNVNDDNIIPIIREKCKFSIKYHRIDRDDYEYYCYISLDDTSKSGGWKIPEHLIGGIQICSPKYVISDESYNELKKNNQICCPICHSNINDFVWVNPKCDVKQENIEFIGGKLFRDTHELITKNDLQFRDHKLIEMNDLDFELGGYKINVPYLTTEMNPHMMVCKTRENFIINVNKSCGDFLCKINMDNVCVAGGFCKSMILNQDVKDIDLFLYGSNDPNFLINRMKLLLNDIMKILGGHYMIMHKKNNNVFEMIRYTMCGEDIKKVSHKIQIILTINEDISKIFSDFDLDSSRVAFNGKHVYFDQSSFLSFKYMINVVDENKYTDTFDHRLKKYFDLGFSVVVPDLNMDKIKNYNSIKLGNCKFNGLNISGDKIYVDNMEVGNNKCRNKKIYEEVSDGMYSSFNTNDPMKMINETLKYIENINKEEIIIKYKFMDNQMTDKIFEEIFGNNVPFIKKFDKVQKFDWYGKFRC